MRLAALFGVVSVSAALAMTSACQFDYELGFDGMAGSGSDLGGNGGGPIPSSGGVSGLGGTPGTGGGNLGGAEAGGTDSGGGTSGGGALASGGTSSGGTSGGGAGGTTPVLIVTTEQDEEDLGATPSSPGQTGFSLREAILFANQDAGHHEIGFLAQYTIDLVEPLPTITKTAHITGSFGGGSVSISGLGAGASAPCLSVNASDVVIESLWILDCPAEPVSFEPGSGSGNMLTACYIDDAGLAGTFYGDAPVILFNYWNGSNASAIEVYATDAEVLANRVDDAVGAGIYVDDAADGALLLANVLIDAGTGIDLRGFDGARLWHNTIVESDSDGVRLTSSTNVDFRNNIVFGSTELGVDGNDGQFTFFDYNLYFDNASGDCGSCTLAANDLSQDPLFVDPGGNDYAPQPASPAVDSGFDLGDDRNLGDPGLFNGTAPDRGFIETN